MENASKALLIAAAVLIVVLLIVVLIFILNMIVGYQILHMQRHIL